MKTPTEFQIGQLMHQLTVQKPPQAGPPPPPAVKSGNQDQKAELAAAISGLETGLQKLDALIKKREAAAPTDPKAVAKKGRAAKESTKPKTAAEKAKIDRENKLAAKNQQKSGTASKQPVSELKTLATKIRGQIAVAKQKLAAL